MVERLHIVPDTERTDEVLLGELSLEQARDELAKSQAEIIALQQEISRLSATVDRKQADRDLLMARVAVLGRVIHMNEGSLT